MSYAKFFPMMTTSGRSSSRLPPVSYKHRFRINKRKRNSPREHHFGYSVYIISPHQFGNSQYVHIPINYRFMIRTFGKLDDINDFAPTRVKLKYKHIRKKWGIKMWGYYKRITGRYQMKWCCSNYF